MEAGEGASRPRGGEQKAGEDEDPQTGQRELVSSLGGGCYPYSASALSFFPFVLATLNKNIAIHLAARRLSRMPGEGSSVGASVQQFHLAIRGLSPYLCLNRNSNLQREGVALCFLRASLANGLNLLPLF